MAFAEKWTGQSERGVRGGRPRGAADGHRPLSVFSPTAGIGSSPFCVGARLWSVITAKEVGVAPEWDRPHWKKRSQSGTAERRFLFFAVIEKTAAHAGTAAGAGARRSRRRNVRLAKGGRISGRSFPTHKNVGGGRCSGCLGRSLWMGTSLRPEGRAPRGYCDLAAHRMVLGAWCFP